MAKKPNPTIDDIDAQRIKNEAELVRSYSAWKGVSAAKAKKEIAELSAYDDTDGKLAQIYSRIAETLEDAGAEITEEILKDYIPGIVLDLAVDLDLIDHPEAGPVWIGPYFVVTETFRDGFLEALPIDLYLDLADWLKPNPAEIYRSFLLEVRPTLNETAILKLMIGTDRLNTLLGQKASSGHDEATLIRDTAERKFLDTRIKKYPVIPNQVQHHHLNLAQIIRKHSKRWAAIEPTQLCWRRK